MDEGCTYTDRIGPDADGETVARFYAARYRHSSEADWRARAEAGLILRNGLPAGPDERLRAGDVLRWNRPPWREPDVPRDVRVVFADEDVILVDKPAGLPTIPGGGFVRNTLAAILRERFPGEAPVPVHRLGRGTSGLVLCARRPSARDALARQFREAGGEERALRKRYLARTASVADPPAGDLEIAVPIGRVPHALLGAVWAAAPGGGKPSITVCRLLENGPDAALWEAEPRTGRPHQIRIHLAAIGHPLLGDPLFLPGGGARPDVLPGATGYFLRAWSLSFRHPATGRIVEFRLPDPRRPDLCSRAADRAVP